MIDAHIHCTCIEQEGQQDRKKEAKSEDGKCFTVSPYISEFRTGYVLSIEKSK